jgi:hypothetical protein
MDFIKRTQPSAAVLITDPVKNVWYKYLQGGATDIPSPPIPKLAANLEFLHLAPYNRKPSPRLACLGNLLRLCPYINGALKTRNTHFVTTGETNEDIARLFCNFVKYAITGKERKILIPESNAISIAKWIKADAFPMPMHAYLEKFISIYPNNECIRVDPDGSCPGTNADGTAVALFDGKVYVMMMDPSNNGSHTIPQLIWFDGKDEENTLLRVRSAVLQRKQGVSGGQTQHESYVVCALTEKKDTPAAYEARVSQVIEWRGSNIQEDIGPVKAVAAIYSPEPRSNVTDLVTVKEPVQLDTDVCNIKESPDVAHLVLIELYTGSPSLAVSPDEAHHVPIRLTNGDALQKLCDSVDTAYAKGERVIIYVDERNRLAPTGRNFLNAYMSIRCQAGLPKQWAQRVVAIHVTSSWSDGTPPVNKMAPKAKARVVRRVVGPSPVSKSSAGTKPIKVPSAVNAIVLNMIPVESYKDGASESCSEVYVLNLRQELDKDSSIQAVGQLLPQNPEGGDVCTEDPSDPPTQPAVDQQASVDLIKREIMPDGQTGNLTRAMWYKQLCMPHLLMNLKKGLLTSLAEDQEEGQADNTAEKTELPSGRIVHLQREGIDEDLLKGFDFSQSGSGLDESTDIIVKPSVVDERSMVENIRSLAIHLVKIVENNTAKNQPTLLVSSSVSAWVRDPVQGLNSFLAVRLALDHCLRKKQNVYAVHHCDEVAHTLPAFGDRTLNIMHGGVSAKVPVSSSSSSFVKLASPGWGAIGHWTLSDASKPGSDDAAASDKMLKDRDYVLKCAHAEKAADEFPFFAGVLGATPPPPVQKPRQEASKGATQEPKKEGTGDANQTAAAQTAEAQTAEAPTAEAPSTAAAQTAEAPPTAAPANNTSPPATSSQGPTELSKGHPPPPTTTTSDAAQRLKEVSARQQAAESAWIRKQDRIAQKTKTHPTAAELARIRKAARQAARQAANAAGN